MTWAAVKVLPAAGDAQEHLPLLAGFVAGHEFVDGLRLIAAERSGRTSWKLAGCMWSLYRNPNPHK